MKISSLRKIIIEYTFFIEKIKVVHNTKRKIV